MIVGFGITPLLSRRVRPFGWMTPQERTHWVEESEYSRFRLRRDALAGLRTLIEIAYASDPRVPATIGYDGSPLVAVDHEKLASPPELDIKQFPDLGSDDIETDVIVVGTGAGGAVVASVLAEEGLAVVLLEEGGKFDREDFASRRPVERCRRERRSSLIPGPQRYGWRPAVPRVWWPRYWIHERGLAGEPSGSAPGPQCWPPARRSARVCRRSRAAPPRKRAPR